MKIFILSIFLICFCFMSYGQFSGIDSLKQQLSGVKEDTAKVNLLFSLSKAYAWRSSDTSILYARQALTLAKKLDYKSGEANSLIGLGWTSIPSGNYNDALRFLYQSIPIFTKLQDTLGLLDAFLGLGICYRDQGDFENSKIWIYQSLILAELSHSRYWTVSSVLYHLSSVLVRNHQLDSALKCAIIAYQEPANKTKGGLMYVLGAIHSNLGHDSIALVFLRRAVSNATKDNVQVDVIDSYNGISKIYLKEGKADSAIFYANLALHLQGGKTYPIGMFYASELLSKIYESQKNTDSTLKYMKLTIALKDSLFNQQKTRDASAFVFNEQLHQLELAGQQEKNQNRIRTLSLGSAVLLFLVAGILLWRNNRHRRKAFILLQKQKKETDNQKTKVEKTLEELKSTQAQLIQSEKMASLGEMTAGIAHEIQNPLNFVNNFSEVSNELVDEMKSELATGNQLKASNIADDIKQNLEKINHHGKRADAIVKGMLQHSKASSGTQEPTDINKLADEFLRLSYHGMRAREKSFNVELTADFDDSIGQVRVVPQDIGRVLLNLFNNAFYAVSETQKKEGDAFKPVLAVSTKRIGNQVEINVSDNGVGIPQKIVDKIFQPFFTTKPTGQGTGLGLSLAYDIVKAHGGEIKVESKEGLGSTFTIELPG